MEVVQVWGGVRWRLSRALTAFSTSSLHSAYYTSETPCASILTCANALNSVYWAYLCPVFAFTMGSQYAFDRISGSDFEDILSQYPDVVPSKLADLEEQRLSVIPDVLAERRSEGKAYLTKSEVATLVDWKL